MAWKIRSSQIVGNQVRTVLVDETGNAQTVVAPVPGVGSGAAPASQHSGVGGNGTGKPVGDAPAVDAVEAALVGAYDRLTRPQGRLASEERIQRQNAQDRVRRATLQGMIPDAEDLKLAALTEEEAKANWGKERVAQVAEANRARQVPKDRQSRPTITAGEPQLLDKREVLRELDAQVDRGADMSRASEGHQTDLMGNLYLNRNATWKLRARLAAMPGEWISKQDLERLKRETGADAVRESANSTTESRAGITGKKAVGAVSAAVVARNRPEVAADWADRPPSYSGQERWRWQHEKEQGGIGEEIRQVEQRLAVETDPMRQQDLMRQLTQLRARKRELEMSGLLS